MIATKCYLGITKFINYLNVATTSSISQPEVEEVRNSKVHMFCEISTLDLTGTKYIGQIYCGDFAKFCGLLRIYEL